MTKHVFDEPYVAATILNRVFNDQSPQPAVYNNQVVMATSIGLNAFALSFGAAYAGLTEDQLSTRLLGNLGVLPNAGLQVAVRDYLVSVGKANVGIVALQLGQILSGLEQATGDQAVFNVAAVAWNKELELSYAFSTNPANDASGPPERDDQSVTGVTLSLTSGDDAISLTAPQGQVQEHSQQRHLPGSHCGLPVERRCHRRGCGGRYLEGDPGRRCHGGTHAAQCRKGLCHCGGGR